MTGRQKRAAELHGRVPHDWYARSIKENILQNFWHKRRFEVVSNMITPASSVLDIGCNDGTFTMIIAKKTRASRVCAVDVLPKSIAYAKKRFATSKKFFFKVADAHKLPYRDKSFDAIFCLETLEHVEEPQEVISEMYRLVEDNGYVVVLVPTENFLFKYIVWPLWSLTPWQVWKGTHLHDYSADEIVVKLQKGGFEIRENKKFLLGMLQGVKAVRK